MQPGHHVAHLQIRHANARRAFQNGGSTHACLAGLQHCPAQAPREASKAACPPGTAATERAATSAAVNAAREATVSTAPAAAAPLCAAETLGLAGTGRGGPCAQPGARLPLVAGSLVCSLVCSLYLFLLPVYKQSFLATLCRATAPAATHLQQQLPLSLQWPLPGRRQ